MLLVAFGQQNMTLGISRDVWQSSFVNPAYQPDRKFILALPSLQFDYYTPRVGVRQLFSQSSILNFSAGLDQLPEQSEFGSRQQLDAAGIGFRVKDGWFMVHFSGMGTQRATVPKDLARLMFLGNGNYVGQTLNIGPSFELSAHTELGLQAAWKFDKLSVGVRAKRWWGIYNFNAEPADILLYTDTSIYDITLTTNYQVNATQAIDNIEWAEGDAFPNIDLGGAGRGGRGWGFDAGATYDINDRWQVGASVANLGVINWTGKKSYASKGSFTYEGVRIENILKGDSLRLQEAVDSFINLVNPVEINGTDFTSKVPTRYVVSAEFKPSEMWVLHGLVSHERNRNVNYTGYLVGARFKPHRVIDVGLNINGRYRYGINLGGAISLNLGPLQIYGMADNIANAFQPFYVRNYNARVGANLVFGKVNKDE